MAVKALAAQRHEERARPPSCACRSTRATTTAPSPRRVPCSRAAAVRGFGPASASWRAPARGAAPPAPRASVGKGQAPAGDLLVVLVALAGDQHHVARRRAVPAPGDGRARGRRSTTMRDARGHAAHQVCPVMACGSSPRGLSLVRHAGRSAVAAATAPISGRLPRSRSPPQPKTQLQPAAAALPPAGAGPPAAPVQRVRACARNRPRPAAARGRRARCMRPGGELSAAMAATAGQRHARARQHAQHAEQVGHVEAPEQPAGHFGAAPELTRSKARPAWVRRSARPRGKTPARRRWRRRRARCSRRAPRRCRRAFARCATPNTSSMFSTAPESPGTSNNCAFAAA